MKSLTICCLLTFLAIASAKVEKCYVCNSSGNKACADPFEENESLSEKCPTTGNYVCMKIGTEADGVENDDRKCFLENQAKAECEKLEAAAEGTALSLTCNFCDTDNCNTGTLHRVSAFLLGVILFVYYISK